MALSSTWTTSTNDGIHLHTCFGEARLCLPNFLRTYFLPFFFTAHCSCPAPFSACAHFWIVKHDYSLAFNDVLMLHGWLSQHSTSCCFLIVYAPTPKPAATALLCPTLSVIMLRRITLSVNENYRITVKQTSNKL